MKNAKLIQAEKREAIAYWKKRYDTIEYVFFPLILLVATLFLGWLLLMLWPMAVDYCLKQGYIYAVMQF